MCTKQAKLNKTVLLAVVLAMTSSVALANLPPVAEAGENQTMYLGEAVTLQGSATDPDGDPILSWEWQVISAPTGSAYDLTHADTANALFTTDMIGDYAITLIASDGLLWSDPDAAVVIVVENEPPVAIIEAAPLSGPAPLLVSFDGTNSYDPEGETLLYDWNFGDLTFGTGANVSHEYTNPGIYAAKLFVEDEFGNAVFETIEITVTDTDAPPTVACSATPTSGPVPLRRMTSVMWNWEPQARPLLLSRTLSAEHMRIPLNC